MAKNFYPSQYGQITQAALSLSKSLAVAALTVFAVSTANAQPDNDQTARPAETLPPAGPSDAAEKLEEIIVTARRIKENLQDAPVSVQSVSGNTLETQRLNDVTQLANAVPSLAVGADNSLYLRGVGSQVFTANVDSSVGIAVDEVSLGVPLFMGHGLLDDIERIEVLGGPQGILFGRNTSAGLLNVLTSRPEMAQFYGRASSEFDYRDTLPEHGTGFIQKVTVNAPISDTSALRINASYLNQDPITRLVNGSPKHRDLFQRRQAIRAKYLLQPTSQLSVYAIGDYSRETGIGGSLESTFRAFAPGSVTEPIAVSEGVTAGPENFDAAADGDLRRSISTGGVSTNVSYDLSDELRLTNILAWRFYRMDLSIDTDNTARDLFNINNPKDSYDQYSNELRLTFRSGAKVDGQAGIYIFESKLDREAQLGGNLFQPTPPPPTIAVIGNYNAASQTNRSYAAFGQINYRPTDADAVFAGARYTHDKVTADGASTTDGYLAPFRPVGTFATGDSVDNVSWKAGAQHKLSADVMVYASYGTGYKGPTYNAIAGLPGDLLKVGPEKVNDLEAGIKSELLDHKLRVNISAFHMNFDNFQVQSFLPALNAFVLQNAAKVKSNGIEASISARPISALTLSASATYLDAEFGDFPGAQCTVGQTEPSTCTGKGGVYNASGHTTPGTAKLKTNLEAIYKLPLSANWGATLEANYSHRSSVNSDTSGLAIYSIPGIDILGASIGFQYRNTLQLGLFCKNCTNKIYPAYIGGAAVDNVIAGIPSTQQQWNYDSIRTLGVSFSAQF